MTQRQAFGDFQTPPELARAVTRVVHELVGTPGRVIEPTMGHGTFLATAIEEWGERSRYAGYEINPAYVALARERLGTRPELSVELHQSDFFSRDWESILRAPDRARPLVLGNPPWVTNAALGKLGRDNLPAKTNAHGLRGLEARTGKANFDIAEWMLLRLAEALPADGSLAMLCKTATARKVLRQLWKTGRGGARPRLFRIDATASFDVTVEACLLVLDGERADACEAVVHEALDLGAPTRTFGLRDGELVSDLAAMERLRHLDAGPDGPPWRSGIKHDAARVMEFTNAGDGLRNGLGETVELEPAHLFPLLKSSDLGNGRGTPRKWVLATQRHPGEDTGAIAATAPRTWAYLQRHAGILDGRKSSIYRQRPRFAVFGVGPYSFAPWKVAVSGLYKAFRFVVVPPHAGRPVMVDDTCYALPCADEAEARERAAWLNSEPARAFLAALTFRDAKRPLTADVLRRLSLDALARELTEKSPAAPSPGRRAGCRG